MKLLVKLVSENAKLPSYATANSAGMDLSACLDDPLTLKPGQRALIPTGISIALPAGYAGLIYARSGLAVKNGVALSNGVGVIDSDYRGEIKCGVINLGEESYVIQAGERIAQLIVTPYACPDIEITARLPETQRGSGGFGSTGTL